MTTFPTTGLTFMSGRGGVWGEGCSAATWRFTTRCHYILHTDPLMQSIDDAYVEMLMQQCLTVWADSPVNVT